MAIFDDFTGNGKLSSLETAILLVRLAFVLLPPNDPYEQTYVTNLAQSIRLQFGETGQTQDIDEAIALHRRLLELDLEDHSHSFSGLGTALRIRFTTTRQLADIQESIACHRLALEVRPRGNPNRPKSLHNLANALLDHATEVDSLDHTTEAIGLYQEALQTFHTSDPVYIDVLGHLGTAFHVLFNHTHMISDLDKSITYHRQAIESISDDDYHNRDYLLHNLASALYERGSQTNQLVDFAEAMKLQHDVAALLPKSHVDRPATLNNLAEFHAGMFEIHGRITDIEAAVAIHRESLSLLNGSEGKAMSLNNLGFALPYMMRSSRRKLKPWKKQFVCFVKHSPHSVSRGQHHSMASRGLY